MHRVLRPGGQAIMSFSNRCFPSKAVKMWLNQDDEGRQKIVASYFHYAPFAGWENVMAIDLQASHARKLLAEASSPLSPLSPLSCTWCLQCAHRRRAHGRQQVRGVCLTSGHFSAASCRLGTRCLSCEPTRGRRRWATNQGWSGIVDNSAAVSLSQRTKSSHVNISSTFQVRFRRFSTFSSTIDDRDVICI